MFSQVGDALKIGIFSASSNLTGVLTDTIAVTSLLHNYNCLAFWDYATAGKTIFYILLLCYSSYINYSSIHQDRHESSDY